jgi:hypothetical protein
MFSTESSFDEQNCCIQLNDSKKVGTLSLCINTNEKLTTCFLADPLHVTLFRQLLTWYQYLRNYQRSLKERNACNKSAKSENYIFRAYYGIIKSAPEWEVRGAIQCTAMRIILGSPVPPGNVIGRLKWLPPPSWQYCEGDDLSENAYRISQELYMRWGYTNEPMHPVIMNSVILDCFDVAHKVATICCNTCHNRLDTSGYPSTVSGQRFKPYEVIFVR